MIPHYSDENEFGVFFVAQVIRNTNLLNITISFDKKI